MKVVTILLLNHWICIAIWGTMMKDYSKKMFILVIISEKHLFLNNMVTIWRCNPSLEKNKNQLVIRSSLQCNITLQDAFQRTDVWPTTKTSTWTTTLTSISNATSKASNRKSRRCPRRTGWRWGQSATATTWGTWNASWRPRTSGRSSMIWRLRWSSQRLEGETLVNSFLDRTVPKHFLSAAFLSGN